MIYIITQKGLYQNSVNSSLVSTSNCIKIYVILNGYPLNIYTPHTDDLLNSYRKFCLGLTFKLILRTFKEIELSLMWSLPLRKCDGFFVLFRKEVFKALFIRKLFHLPDIYDVSNSPYTRQRIIGRFFYIIWIVL